MPDRKRVFPFLLAAAALSACASVPSLSDTPTATYVDRPWAKAQADLRELRNAEARVRLIRTRIDFDGRTDAASARELLTARDELRRLRSHNPTLITDSDLAYNPLAIPGYLNRGWRGGVLGIDGRPVPQTRHFTQKPLSGIR